MKATYKADFFSQESELFFSSNQVIEKLTYLIKDFSGYLSLKLGWEYGEKGNKEVCRKKFPKLISKMEEIIAEEGWSEEDEFGEEEIKFCFSEKNLEVCFSNGKFDWASIEDVNLISNRDSDWLN